MPDRVKEAVFSMLGSRYGTLGDLPALHVADVFAGSGSMGLEALSRGAATCCFFERDPSALIALRRNLDMLQAGPEATIVQKNAWTAAAGSVDGEPFDLVFLDPPYRDSSDPSPSGAVHQYLERVRTFAERLPIVVLHHRATIRFEAAAGPWRVADHRVFGTSAITMFTGPGAD